jgi:LuxR family maltose regulon positive regulatory protein
MTATLEERTEGWVAGLQLAALSLPGHPDRQAFLSSFSGGHRYLVEYLLEEVVGRRPQHVQSFLFSTSILERLCGPLCDAILDAGQGTRGESEPRPSPLYPSASILEELEHTNLFLIPLDDERQWYRYHHLFRDFLQSRLDKTRPDRIPALHRAASEWYGANGLLREAVQHAFQTRDWDYAADCVERHGFTLIARGELATLSAWCAAFPEEVLGTHPVLCLLQSWALVMRLRRQNRDRIETRLRQVEGLAAVLDDREQAGALIEHAAVLRSYLALVPDPAADPRAQLALARSRLDTNPQEDTGRLSVLLTAGYAHMALHDARAATEALEAARQAALHGRLYAGVVESAFHLARLAHVQGDLPRAADICRQGQADIAALLAHPEQQLPAAGCLDIALGCVLLEQDRPEDAEQALLAGFDRSGWGMNTFYLMTGCLALYRLRASQGRSPEALECLTRLEEAWPDIAFCTRGLRAVHALQASPGDPAPMAEAASWCDDVTPLFGDDAPLPGMGPFGAAEVYYLASLAWARAQIALGRPQAVLPYLRRQLELAMSHGLTNRIRELTLLEGRGGRAEGRPVLVPCPETGESLTERELEVLRLMAQGASNQAIAKQLFITVGTVKSHINHVLGKLNAHNRTEAVARARALGWLET